MPFTNIHFYIKVFTTLFIIADPLGNLIPYLHLTKDFHRNLRYDIAIKAAVYATFILMFFALLSKFIFRYLTISLASLEIIGGILLFLIALNMLFKGKSGTAEKTEHPALTPLATPLLAGPGAIAMAIVFMNEAAGLEKMGVILTIILTMICVMLIFLSSNIFFSILKREGLITLSKVSAIFLGAIAVEMVIVGIKSAF